tara:strand:- start:2827 stop:3279 length:453 start_codon:yes stop_codon:yes gene_type:complete
MPIYIQKVPVLEILEDKNFKDIAAEYAEESKIEGMPPIDWQTDIYQGMEDAGVIHVFKATDNGEMVGFLSMIISRLPHYGVLAATVESVFVSKGSGAGSRLLDVAQGYAEDEGCEGFLVSAPVGGRLAALAPKMGFIRTNEIFFRGFESE